MSVAVFHAAKMLYSAYFKAQNPEMDDETADELASYAASQNSGNFFQDLPNVVEEQRLPLSLFSEILQHNSQES